MADSSFSISIGDALPYLEEKFLRMIGRDAATLDEKQWMRSLHLTAINLTKSAQCVGMSEPVLFERIYQPTRLRKNTRRRSFLFTDDQDDEGAAPWSNPDREEVPPEVTINEFISSKRDAIIFGGPGWGKTTFLHHIFRRLLYQESVMPILIALRRPTAVADLERIVDLSSEKKKDANKTHISLIVDGYDEVKTPERKRVSEALFAFQSYHVGNFYLSCRDHYEVLDLKAPEHHLDRFARVDKVRFITAFLSILDSRLDPNIIMEEFEARGLGYFLSHPLLLSLACIVRSSSQSLQPRSALRLLERALETLAFRWDDQRGVDRETYTPLDGRDRIQILKRIAHASKSPFLPESRVNELAQEELRFLTFDRVDPHRVLLETAQFYGIMVPAVDGWEFVHRSLQDYLAAKYSVETGEFAKITDYDWTTRTAYAACLMHNSRPVLEAALASPHGIPTATEILSNFPNFDLDRASSLIVDYFASEGRAWVIEMPSEDRIRGSLRNDFIRSANTPLLNRLVETCCTERTPTKDIVCGYCLLELRSREASLSSSLYGLVKKAYVTERFTFYLVSAGYVSLSSLCPETSSNS